MLKKIKRWFKIFTGKTVSKPKKDDYINVDIKPGDAFGISTGKFLGEFFIYMERSNNDLKFLSLPKMKTRIVPVEKYQSGLQDNVLEYVERLPKYAIDICQLQYKTNKQNEVVTHN